MEKPFEAKRLWSNWTHFPSHPRCWPLHSPTLCGSRRRQVAGSAPWTAADSSGATGLRAKLYGDKRPKLSCPKHNLSGTGSPDSREQARGARTNSHPTATSSSADHSQSPLVTPVNQVRTLPGTHMVTWSENTPVVEDEPFRGHVAVHAVHRVVVSG